ncbi:MAG: hypothetical protein AMS18_07095 [Gemmatimonas sp. SG8_17]|nr:MAG: hypothetical protein AMS18_07095 [Gemmatimonas sp. SG8_17]
MNLEPEDLTKIIDALVKVAPGAGLLVVVAVCFRIMGETPGNLLRGFASILWGWKRKNGNGSNPPN